MKKLFISLSAIILLALCLTDVYGQDLVILHTNDTHSQILPEIAGKGKGLGGYERRENYINSVRAENKNVLLMDGGDFFQGTPFFSMFRGDLEIELMSMLKYDVACLGNHEFDNGQKMLASKLRNASFPVVCANYDFKMSPLKDIVKPYVVLNKGGKKIGVIGVLINIRSLVNPDSLKGIKYIQPYKIVNKLAKTLRVKENCDIVIVLSHCGFSEGSVQNPSDILIAKNTEGVDFIIGAHSHTFLAKQEVVKNKAGQDVVIVQTGEHGQHVGRLNIWF